ncbi:hypothetical protein GCM10020216_038990 [Nonomuraea helvata]
MTPGGDGPTLVTMTDLKGAAVVRPPEHVSAVFGAVREWEAQHPEYAPTGNSQAFLWVLGKRSEAPITRRRAVGLPTREEVQAEIKASEEPGKYGVAQRTAWGVSAALEWLLGVDDAIPVPGVHREGLGHLVGGRGRIVRTSANVTAVLDRARRGPRVASIEWQTSWCEGVIACCEWVLGRRPGAPVSDRPPAQPGLPTGDDLSRELAPVEDVRHQLGPGRRHSQGYGDGVHQTIQWLLGRTTVAPVDERGLPPADGNW